jgi:hypothetical protein
VPGQYIFEVKSGIKHPQTQNLTVLQHFDLKCYHLAIVIDKLENI